MASDKKQTKEKPLEKMTATELRDIAKELPDIVGAHGMNKSELIRAIKKAKGVEEDTPKKGGDASVRDIKLKIKELKKQKKELLSRDDRKKAKIYRRKINRLKKQTRKAV